MEFVQHSAHAQNPGGASRKANENEGIYLPQLETTQCQDSFSIKK